MREVDILLATYNGEKYLAEQLDSILSQTHTQWRLLIRDDDSSDSTLDIIQEYIGRYPSQIILIQDNEKNLGAYQNFARLLQEASSDYVMFCDQDDVWLETKIEETLKVMIDNERTDTPLLVHTDLVVVDEKLQTLHPSFVKKMRINVKRDRFNQLLMRNIATGCTMMINRPLLDLILPLPEKGVIHDWWIVLVASIYGHIIYLDRATILYRQHGNNTIGASQESGWEYIQEEFDFKTIELIHTVQQAILLKQRYEETLPVEKKKTLEIFTNLLENRGYKRKLLQLRYGFLYHNVFKNLGLMVKS